VVNEAGAGAGQGGDPNLLMCVHGIGMRWPWSWRCKSVMEPKKKNC